MTLVVALAWLAAAGSLACWLVVLVRQFEDAGALSGALGVVTCGAWTLVWGWRNARRLGLARVVRAWTALVGLYVALAAVDSSRSW